MNLEPTSYTITKVAPFKESVQEYLKSRPGADGTEKHTDRDQLALLNGGVLTDIRYSWLSNGSKFEVIHSKTGSKVAAWNFGALLHDFDTTVACVADLPSVHGKPPIVVVGLDCELTGGMVCFFDINSSRVIRAIQIDDKVSSIHVVNAGNDLSLPGALRALDGVLAIGTHRGKVLLVDICRQICDEAILSTGDRVKDEINSCHLTSLSLCDLEHLEYHKERSLMNENHICIQLNHHSTSGEHFALHGPDRAVRLYANMVEVAISALYYCPQLGSLLVGFNFGAFQLYNLSNMQLIYTSPVYEDCIPISHFAVQEPCDDPRAYCYVWVVYNTIEKGDKTFPMAVMYAFAYNNKDYLEGYGHLYQEFVSCSVRFQMELTSVSDPRLSGQKNAALGAKCLSLHSYSKALASRQGAAPFVDVPEEKLALCNIVWTTWNTSSVVETYFCLFDLNQWYKEQMPASTQLLSTDSVCSSYISCVSLSKLLSPVSSNELLLDIRINSNTFNQFVCAQRLEEHYFPSALAFQGVVSRGNDCVWFSNSGVQRHLLTQLEMVGSLGLIRPTELFQRCLDLGLTPIYTDLHFGNSTSLKIQRELILSVALEHQLVRWLCQCGRDWANGSQSSAGCTLDLLLDWAWQRANVLKFQSDKLCIPLFDYTGSRLDANAVIQLNHCACQLKNLTILFEHVLENFAMYFSEQDLVDIRYQTQTLQMISTHLEVLHWLLNVGLLPECPLSMYPLPDETERVSAPYPAEKLSRFYQCKRKEFHHLQHPNEEELLSPNAFTTSCDLLFIDNLIDLECKGNVLRKQWECDGGNGLYPPPSLQALLRAYFIEDIDIVHKHCLFIYVFLDLAMTLDQSRYKSIITHLIKFPAVFKINPSIIKITQAFWQLDHGDFSTAMTQLLDPSVNNEDFKPWHHRTLLKALLIQGQQQHALLYQQVRKPPVSSIEDICITTTLLIVNNLVQEAFHFQRQHRSLLNVKEILMHFFETCDKMNQLPLVLHLPLAANEEQEFLSYLKKNPDAKIKNLLVMFYLQRAQYADAFLANDILNQTGVMKQGLLGQQDRHFRNVVISGFRRTLPSVTQSLLDFCNKNKPKVVPQINVPRPNPMSVYVHDTTEQAKYKSTLIQASFLKAKETWKQPSEQSSLDETPFISMSKIATTLASPRMNSSLIYPSIVEVNNKNITEEHDISEDATPAKRRRLSLKNSINNASLSHNLDTSLSRRTISCYNSASLLSTPIVKRRSYRSTSVASNILDSFVGDTPTSILKVRSFIRNSQSPETRGNSTTPEILEDEISEAQIQTAAAAAINLDTSAIKRRSSLRITPRKSISQTPRLGVHFEDGRRPNSQSSNESGENPDVRKMSVCNEVHREQTSEEANSQIDSKNSSDSIDDVFYSPKQSLSFSDQKTSDISAISSSLSEQKELSKISGVSTLESNSFDDKNDNRSSLKRKANDNTPSSVRSRRSYRNSSNTSQETCAVEPLLKIPEVIPKLTGRKSMTRQVLEHNLKMKVLSTPSFRALFSPQNESSNITISKSTAEVINIHTSGDFTKETRSVTTTEIKDEILVTKNEHELQTVHNFNESFSKSVTKMSETIEQEIDLRENIVPTLENSHILSFNSDTNESNISHFYKNISEIEISSTTSKENEQQRQEKEEAILEINEQQEEEIDEKIFDQSTDEEQEVHVEVESESDKVQIEEDEQEIIAVNSEETEEENEMNSNEDRESEEESSSEIEEISEGNYYEEEEPEDAIENLVIEEDNSVSESSDKSSQNEEEDSRSSANFSDIIEIQSSSEENSRESNEKELLKQQTESEEEAENKEEENENEENLLQQVESEEDDEILSTQTESGKDEEKDQEKENESIHTKLDDKLVYIEPVDESRAEEDEENVSAGIYDDLDDFQDITSMPEDTKGNVEEITEAQENRSLMVQDYEENMQAIEEVTEKENEDVFVAESVKDQEEIMEVVEEEKVEDEGDNKKIFLDVLEKETVNDERHEEEKVRQPVGRTTRKRSTESIFPKVLEKEAVNELHDEKVQKFAGRMTRKRSASIEVHIEPPEVQPAPTSSRVLRRLRSNSTTDLVSKVPYIEGRSLRKTRSQSVDTPTSTKTPRKKNRASIVQLDEIQEEEKVDKKDRRTIRTQSIENAADVPRQNRRGVSLEPEMLVKKRNVQSDVILEELEEEKGELFNQELTTVPSKIEEYSATHRMTRRQKLIMKKNLEKSQALIPPTVDIVTEEPTDNTEHLGTPKKQRKTRKLSVTTSVTSSSTSLEGPSTPSARPRRRSFTQAQQAIHTPTSTIRRRSSSKASSSYDPEENFSDTASVVSVPVAQKGESPEQRYLRHRSLSPSMLKKGASPRTSRGKSIRGLVLPPKTDLSNISEEQSTGSAAAEENAKKGGSRKRVPTDASGESQSSQARQSTARRTIHQPLEAYQPRHMNVKTRKSYKFRKFSNSDSSK